MSVASKKTKSQETTQTTTRDPAPCRVSYDDSGVFEGEAVAAERASGVVTPELVTGTCDTGDVLENMLDELQAVLAAVVELHTASGNDDNIIGNLMYMALRKAEAAATIYDGARSKEVTR